MTGSKRALERILATLEPFHRPQVTLEQYVTPADIAAHLVHVMGEFGDLAGRTVVDLGTGTGILALGCALGGSGRVIALDRDPAALRIARTNERRIDGAVTVDWVLADATRSPICTADATVVMNPPFGAQRSNVHADRRFLDTARSIAGVSYSFHNEGSRPFVAAYATDYGGTITHEWRVEFELDRQFEFHSRSSTVVTAELVRIEWNQVRPG